MRKFKLEYKKNKLLDKVECKHLDVSCGIMVSNNDPKITEEFNSPKITEKHLIKPLLYV
jgi:hypothetical protein